MLNDLPYADRIMNTKPSCSHFLRQLHVGASSGSGEPTTPDAAEKSVDFFEEHSNGSSEAFSDQDAFFGHAPGTPKLNEVFDADKPGPKVDGILSTSPSKSVPLKKSTIGARKPAAKKPGVFLSEFVQPVTWLHASHVLSIHPFPTRWVGRRAG